MVLVCAVETIEKNLKNTLLVDFDFQIIDSANKHRLKEAMRTLLLFVIELPPLYAQFPLNRFHQGVRASR